MQEGIRIKSKDIFLISSIFYLAIKKVFDINLTLKSFLMEEFFYSYLYL